MLFNSLEFIVFFVTVYLLFIFVKKYRWVILLIASYVFYMTWHWEYIILILISTGIDYISALQIERNDHKKIKKLYLALSITTNLSILLFFKYYNFFIESISSFSSAPIGGKMEFLLPVGISFYTFQTMSYTIDVYNKKVTAEKNLGRFALFVTYFPQLVAGPIERAKNLISQLRNSLTFNAKNIVPGSKLFLFGLFKKVVIADRVALIVDPIYNNPEDHGAYMLILGTLLFAFQIYCDFSGYSDMAIGLSKFFNVSLIKNFNSPYYANSISDFWRRWHISLSSWFKDYVYIPLGGNRTVKWRWYYNLLITFVISGLWHGANWTFIVWGAYHGIWLILERVLPRLTSNHVLKILWTFILVNIGWVFFRANNLTDAFFILESMFHNYESLSELKSSLLNIGISKLNIMVMIFSISLLLIKDAKIQSLGLFWKMLFYLVLFFSVIVFGINASRPFIYFQF